ncbi:hypothetical protein Hanom_Chr07g00641411 [Helianthus anomalus]
MQDKTSKQKKVPRIKVRAVWTIVDKLKDKMSASLEICNLLQRVAQRHIQTDNPIEGISYAIGVHTLKSTPKDFCQITGFIFGPVENFQSEQSPNSFRSRYFGGYKVVRQRQLEELFGSDWTWYTEDDCLRICLLMMVEYFKGTQVYQAVDDLLLNLVNNLNLEGWNQFPWGTYLWLNTCTSVYNLNQRHQPQNKGFSLPGCVWPFKILYRSKKSEIFELGTRKEASMEFCESDYSRFDNACDLVPTSEKSDIMWFRSSLQHIVSFGLMKPVSEKMQSSFEGHVFENMEVDGGDNDCLHGLDGEVDEGNDGGNDGFDGKVEGFSGSEGHYNMNASKHSRKKRSGKPLGGRPV